MEQNALGGCFLILVWNQHINVSTSSSVLCCKAKAEGFLFLVFGLEQENECVLIFQNTIWEIVDPVGHLHHFCRRSFGQKLLCTFFVVFINVAWQRKHLLCILRCTLTEWLVTIYEHHTGHTALNNTPSGMMIHERFHYPAAHILHAVSDTTAHNRSENKLRQTVSDTQPVHLISWLRSWNHPPFRVYFLLTRTNSNDNKSVNIIPFGNKTIFLKKCNGREPLPCHCIFISSIISCFVAYTSSKNVSGCDGSNTSLQVMTVTRFSVSLRLVILWVQPGIISQTAQCNDHNSQWLIFINNKRDSNTYDCA